MENADDDNTDNGTVKKYILKNPVNLTQGVTAASPLSAILATTGPAPAHDDLKPLIIARDTPSTNDDDESLLTLKPKKRLAILLWLQGIVVDDIAKQLDVRPKAVQKLIESRIAQHTLAAVTKVVLAKLQRGDFGPIAMAKHASEHAMASLIGQMKTARNEQVRRQAAIDVLALAGHVAVKKAEILNVNELIDQMEARELETFISTGKWPDRLRDRAARLTLTDGRQKPIDVTPRNIVR